MSIELSKEKSVSLPGNTHLLSKCKCNCNHNHNKQIRSKTNKTSKNFNKNTDHLVSQHQIQLTLVTSPIKGISNLDKIDIQQGANTASDTDLRLDLDASRLLVDPDNNNDPDLNQQQAEFWFNVARIVTEVLIISFAVILLILVFMIIFNIRYCAIEEFYEIIPKILFVLCVIVAVFSFFKWVFISLQKLLI